MRLNKYLARAGIGSRRACDEMIREGLIELNGSTVTEMGVTVDPEQDDIRVKGERIRPEKKVYFALFKPSGYISSVKKQGKAPTVMDLVAKHTKARVYPVGRLDKDSEGLMLLTNDGELTEKLTHPRYEVPKTYLIKAHGSIDPKKISRLKRGIKLDGQLSRPSSIRIIKQSRKVIKLTMTLKEGRNREIRRLLKAVGCGVINLRRIRIGPLSLGKMVPGMIRELRPKEIKDLYRAAEDETEKVKIAGKKPRRSGKKS